MKRTQLISIYLIQLLLLLPFAFALQLSDVELTGFEEDSTSIQWETDERANATVFWGTGTLVNQNLSNGMGRQHFLTFPTQSGTNYSVIAQSCADGSCVQSERQSFLAGTDTIPPDLTLTVPATINERRLDLTGSTEPYSEVLIFVNGAITRRIGNVGADGQLNIKGVALEREENSIRVLAEDPAGNQYERRYTVNVDTTAPEVQVTNFPETTTEGTYTLEGTVDEPVQLEVFIGLEQDKTAPKRSKGLRASTPLGQNVATITWEASAAEDLLEYNVYRNDRRIAIVDEPRYQDNTVASGETYRYRVSATDTSCNEGALSDTLTIQTASGGNTNVARPKEVESQCAQSDATLEVNGPFSETLELSQGPNAVRIIAVDRAGNRFVWRNTTTLDTTPPVITAHNLAGLTPSYVKDVNIRGKVNERATVYVRIEGEPQPVAYAQTDGNGRFSIPVELLRKVEVTEEGKTRTYGFGGGSEGYLNKITLEAVDGAGLRSQPITGDVIYAQCGFGNYFDVKRSEPKPSTVNPRLILNGAGTFGFNVELEYLGQGEAQLDRPNIRFLPIPRTEQDKYDTEQNVQVQQRWNEERKKGFVELTIEPPNFPEQDTAHPNGWTQAAKELNLSAHRRGGCKWPDLGCYRVPLQLEVTFTEVVERKPGQEAVTGVRGPRAERKVQRVCITPEVQVDQRVDPNLLPNSFLESSSEFFEGAVDVIDTILEPLETVYEILFYGCLLGRVVGFFSDLSTKAKCQEGLLGTVQAFAGGQFHRQVAESGLCSIQYSGDGEDVKRQRENCLRCQKAINKRRQVMQKLKMVCDRIMCPAAPSLQKWTEDAQQRGVDYFGTVDMPSGQEKEVFVGNDCAFTELQTTPEGMKSLKKDWNTHKGDTPSEDRGYDPTALNCANQHPADPRCCGYTYTEEWGSACGWSENSDYAIKESFKQAEREARGTINQRRLYSARSGICKADGKAFEAVATNIYWLAPPANEEGEKVEKARDQSNKESRNSLESVEEDQGVRIRSVGSLGPDRRLSEAYNSAIARFNANPQGRYLAGREHLTDKKIYLIVRMDRNEMDVYRAYAIQTATIAEAPSLGKEAGDRIPANQNVEFVRYDPAENLARFFQPGADGKLPQWEQAQDQWKSALCGSVASTCPENEARRAWDRIRSMVQGVQQDIIVDPSEDLIKSFECGCVTGITAHLKNWRNILSAVRSCFKSIEVTGDGSAGACQALLSQYVCDFIYSAIKCYRGRFGIGNERAIQGSFDGISGVARNLAASGTSVEQSINARYGGNNMFRAAFSERRLVNSMCLFAFTGNWKLDPQALLQTSEAELPVDSQPLLFPCERRYIKFDSSTNPPGLAEFNYHVGYDLFAGADVRYRLKLVCSDGYTCDPNEGFKDGKCDCAGKGEQSVVIDSGSVQQFERIGEEGEIFHTAQQSGYRYDKAVLEYNWRGKRGEDRENSIQCAFVEQGGGPPVDCAFDILTGKYRCGSEAFNEYYARFVRDPLPQYPTEHEIFVLGDKVQFEVPVLQRLPDTAACTGVNTCQDTKYLVTTVKNQHGAIVYTTDPKYAAPTIAGERANRLARERTDPSPRQLQVQGEAPVTVDIGTLQDDWFNYATNGMSVSWATAPIPQDRAVTNVEVGKRSEYNLVFRYTPESNTFSVISAPPGRERIKGEGNRRFVTHAQTQAPIRETLPVKKNTAGDTVLEYPTQNTQYRVTITPPGDTGHTTGDIEIFVPSQEQRQEQNICDARDASNTPYSWSATFEIRDAEAQGLGNYEVSEQVAQVAGRSQFKKVSFTVNCGTSREVGPGIKQREIVCQENQPGSKNCICPANREEEGRLLRLRTYNPEAYKNELTGEGEICVDGRAYSPRITLGSKSGVHGADDSEGEMGVCTAGEKISENCVCGIRKVSGETAGAPRLQAIICKADQECVPLPYAPNKCQDYAPPEGSIPRGPHAAINEAPHAGEGQILNYLKNRYANKIGGINIEELAGQFVENTRGIDPAFAVAVAAQESGFSSDKAKKCNNLFGITAKEGDTKCPGNERFKKYDNTIGSISDFYRKIKEEYLSNRQNTVDKMIGHDDDDDQFCNSISHCYCCDTKEGYKDWLENVPKIREEIHKTKT